MRYNGLAGMAVVAVYQDGSYRWRCEDCSGEWIEGPHRGPRKSVCKACQNRRFADSPAGRRLRVEKRLQGLSREIEACGARLESLAAERQELLQELDGPG